MQGQAFAHLPNRWLITIKYFRILEEAKFVDH